MADWDEILKDLAQAPASPSRLIGGLAKATAGIGDTIIEDFRERTRIPDVPSQTVPKPVTDGSDRVIRGNTKNLPNTITSIDQLDNLTSDLPASYLDTSVKKVADIDVTDPSPENLNLAMSRMSAAEDINDKLLAALAVSSIAEQQMAINMPSYMDRARKVLGLDEIDARIQQSKEADMFSPNNPGDGSYSQQTQSLIDMKADRSLQLPRLAETFALTDPKLSAPMAAASAYLKQLPIIDRLEMARERNREKLAKINSITDVEAKNMAALQGDYRSINWNSPVDVFQVKKNYFNDKEFQKLQQTGLLSTEDPFAIKQLYEFSDNPVDKNRAFRLIDRIEYDALGLNNPNLSTAERQRKMITLEENTKVLRAAYSDKNLSEEVMRQIENEVNTSGLTGTAKNQRRSELLFQAKEDLLRSAVIAQFTSDVTSWKGMNYQDPMVQQAIEASKKITGNATVPLDVFASQYLDMDSPGVTYADKLAALRSYILSSSIGQESAILPQFDGQEVWNKVAPSSIGIWLKSIMGN